MLPRSAFFGVSAAVQSSGVSYLTCVCRFVRAAHRVDFGMPVERRELQISFFQAGASRKLFRLIDLCPSVDFSCFSFVGLFCMDSSLHCAQLCVVRLTFCTGRRHGPLSSLAAIPVLLPFPSSSYIEGGYLSGTPLKF